MALLMEGEKLAEHIAKGTAQLVESIKFPELGIIGP